MAQAKTKSAKPATKLAKIAKPSAVPRKRVYFVQSDFPQTTLQQAQQIASALVDNFAGDSASPPDVALALDISPSSSSWRSLAGAQSPTVSRMAASMQT